ncbi:hypothetical protein [Streptomyces sp. NPDC090994]|uniref:hypothetical protein n=1 Tax=Streptomyces sp. NPDC090994 TaxID=3365969 RepID=UPI003800058E
MTENAETAVHHPGTAAAWRRMVRVRWAWLAGELLVWAGTVGFGAVTGRRSVIPFAVMFTVAALIVVPVTVTLIVSARRAGRVLRAYPWQEQPCVFRRQGRDVLVVLMPERGYEVPLRPSPLRVDPSGGHGDALESMWFAGDLRFGGVVSPPGGHRVVRVTRPNAAKAARARRGASPTADALAERVGLISGGKPRSL